MQRRARHGWLAASLWQVLASLHSPLSAVRRTQRLTLPQVFIDQSMPIIEYYEKRGRVRKINADRDPDTIYEQVRQLFVGM